MRRSGLTCLALVLAGASAPVMAASDDGAKGARIWSFVQEIASDKYEGRGAGSAGYDRAAAVVAARLKAIGLKPAGTKGYYQNIDFLSQKVIAAQSAISLDGPQGSIALKVPEQATIGGRHAFPEALDHAPLVFAGYGLPLTGLPQDDFAGLDVRGKLVVVIAGGPTEVSGARKANARSERIRLLAEKGALGMITLTTAKQIEIPWARQIGLSARSALMPLDSGARDVKAKFFAASISPDASETLFAGSGHTYAELAALADAFKPLPHFELAQKLSAKVVVEQKPVSSANLVAILPGRDAKLAKEHVVLSAHLDGLGIGEPVKGDAIYNGALDNAIGVSSLLEIAKDMARAKQRPRRSILFLIPTAEEAGLLGAGYFVAHPTVPPASIVADINFDMPLPIFPLKTITPIGYEESTLGATAAKVSAKFGLPLVPDPLPDRNVFIRSDQYNFVKAGIPSVFMKFGFERGTPEEATEKAWRANVYHSPVDEPTQPIMPAEIGRFSSYVAALLRQVAEEPARPEWHKDSYFARFAGVK